MTKKWWPGFRLGAWQWNREEEPDPPIEMICQCGRPVPLDEIVWTRQHYRPASHWSPAEWDDVPVCRSCFDHHEPEPPWDTWEEKRGER
jgi:hypothetical protein